MIGTPVRLLTAVLCLEAFATVQPLSAQQAPTVRRTQRVRVSAPAAGLARNVFWMEALSADSVILFRQRYPGPLDTVHVSRAALKTFEVSKHQGSLAWPGFGIGVVVGVFVAIDWADRTSNHSTNGSLSVPGIDNAPGISMRVVGCGLAGAFLGALIHTEQWVTVPLGELRMGLTSLPAGRLGLGVSLAR
jgi:hypothetical protein